MWRSVRRSIRQPADKDPKAIDGFQAANADYFHLTQRLIGAVTGQAGFQDWITAKEVNKSIALLDTRANQLSLTMQDPQFDAASLGTAAVSLLKVMFPEGGPASGTTNSEDLLHAQARIEAEYKTEIAAFGGDPTRADAFRDAILTLETAAGLGDRDHMTIYGITAKDSHLAGAGLQAFLGFFDQRFRDHDYELGRRRARDVLTATPSGTATSLLPIVYTQKDIHAIDTRLDGLRMSQVPLADLVAFKAGMRARLNQMLREMCGEVLSFSAIPGADLILSSLLDCVIAKS